MLHPSGGGTDYAIAIVAHHLIMDGVSQRIIVDDLSSAYTALSSCGVSYGGTDHGSMQKLEFAVEPYWPRYSHPLPFATGAIIHWVM